MKASDARPHSPEFVQKGSGLTMILGVVPLGEPFLDGLQHFEGFAITPLRLEQAPITPGRAQFPRAGMLPRGDSSDRR